MAVHGDTIGKIDTAKPESGLSGFAKDVAEGLSKPFKKLSSKYFYDDEGSRVFQEIMGLEEYYPTRCEAEILEHQAEGILGELDLGRGGFNVVEFGAGDGAKTRTLLSALQRRCPSTVYRPNDISEEALRLLEANMADAVPGLLVKPLPGDYFTVLDGLDCGGSPSLFMFLGGNIGNYEWDDAVSLFKTFRSCMKPGDKFLVGMDLKKDPRVIRLAYDDPHGVTKRFNLNLLGRINRELGGNFDLAKFDFYCSYTPVNGEVRSYIFSLEEQSVFIGAVGQSFSFMKHELLATEISQKYSIDDIAALGKAAGFKTQKVFTDGRGYFADALFAC